MGRLWKRVTKRLLGRHESGRPKIEEKAVDLGRRAAIRALILAPLTVLAGPPTEGEKREADVDIKKGRFLTPHFVYEKSTPGGKVTVMFLSPLYTDAMKQAQTIPLGNDMLVDVYSLQVLKGRLKGMEGGQLVIFHFPSQREELKKLLQELGHWQIKTVELPEELRKELEKDKNPKEWMKALVEAGIVVSPWKLLRHVDPDEIFEYRASRREVLKIMGLLGFAGVVSWLAKKVGGKVGHVVPAPGWKGRRPDSKVVFHNTGGGKYLKELWDRIDNYAREGTIAVFRAPYPPPVEAALRILSHGNSHH